MHHRVPAGMGRYCQTFLACFTSSRARPCLRIRPRLSFLLNLESIQGAWSHIDAICFRFPLRLCSVVALSAGAYLADRYDLALALYPQLRESRKNQTAQERAELGQRNRRRLRRFVLAFLAVSILVGVGVTLVLPNK
jgi:predicted nucleic acid-binding Zn ribbon protein